MEEIIVRAGAGAGKTTRLTSHVFNVAEAFKAEHGRFPNMVVTTFTRKATQELRERLVLKACEMNQLELIEYASSPSKLFITTIHGVLGQFLRKYAHLVDLDNSYSIASYQQFEIVGKSTLKKLVDQNRSYYSLIDRFGFTNLAKLLRQFYESYLSDDQLGPFEVGDFKFDLSSSLKAWGERLAWFSDVIHDDTSDEKWLLWADNLKDVAACASLDFDESTQTKILASLERLGSKPRANKKNPKISEDLEEDVKKALKDFKDFISGPLMDTETWAEFSEVHGEFFSLGKEFVEEILSYKRSTGLLEMSDLELLSFKAMREHPELAEAFSDEWDYWLIDEFQDTSPIQVELLNLMVGKSKSFTVGDPQQSIYYFRGAENLVFDEKEKLVEKSGGLVDQQIKNYRSEPGLLCFFNDFFNRLPDFQPMQPRTDEIDPSQVVAHLSLVETEAEAPKETELQSIVEHLHQLTAQGARLEDICILAKTNKELIDIAWYVNQYDYPTHVHTSSGFNNRREVLDFLLLMKFLMNPHDNEAFIGLVRSPWFYFPEEQLHEKINFKDRASYWQQTCKSLKDEEPILKLIHALRLKNKMGLLAAAQQVLFDMGFVDTSSGYDPTGRRESNIWKLITTLTEEQGRPGFSFLDYVNNTIETMSEDVDEDSDAVAALEPNRINLMTIHASKGLEFDHVFIPFMHKRPNLTKVANFQYARDRHKFGLNIPLGDEGKLTTSISGRKVIDFIKDKELKELDRWLYVALTRAKKSVYLSWNKKEVKDSWVSRLNWPLQSGVFTNEKYSYQVSEGPFEPKPYIKALKEVGAVRPPYLNHEELNKMNVKFSVSSLLDESAALTVPKTKELLPLLVSKTQMGIDLHRALEVLKQDFNFDFSSVASRWFAGKAESVVKGISYVKSLTEPNIKSVISKGEVEWGFQLLTEQGIMEGQIDLWGTDDSGVTWVIDYKSGNEKYSERAFSQLQYYAKALKEYGVNEPIKLAVIYPLQEVTKVKDF